MRLSFSEKCKWAKKGSRFDVDTDAGYFAFRKLVKESGMGSDSLMYYSNAYEATGESGIKALSHRKRMSDSVRNQALERIHEYLYNRVPSHLRKEIGFLVKAKDNRITVSEKRPLFSRPSETSCIEIFQVRYTNYDNRWHLYWMRKSGKWWPYVPHDLIQTIDDCLREVQSDGWGCFWA